MWDEEIETAELQQYRVFRNSARREDTVKDLG
jgi:hypothetical protein